jgi:hypothetical protein
MLADSLGHKSPHIYLFSRGDVYEGDGSDSCHSSTECFDTHKHMLNNTCDFIAKQLDS